MKKLTPFHWILALLLAGYSGAFAQTKNPEVNAFHWHAPTSQASDHHNCFSAEQWQAINAQAEANIEMLETKGMLTSAIPDQLVYFGWPLRLKAGLTDPSYYSISNYVDENAATGIRDYNCGSRSYDGHRGTDIATWPFSWHKMGNNEVEVLAAAAGTIVLKQDGNFDQNCSWNNQQGNGIIVRHADGSRTWYWHFKKNTLTNKGLGATVAAGEYLGVVGSSGISTGPHLHFEVDQGDNNQTLVDPWGGPCNFLGGQSWWAAQKPYYDPKICKVMTHNAAPATSQCPGGEAVNASNTFNPGQLAYFAGYFRDYLPQTNATYTVKRPNGTTWATWTVNNVTTYYSQAYWWWSAYLPTSGANGTWTFQVSYQGQTQTHTFTVGPSTCAVPTGLFTSNITQTTAKINWTAVSGAINYTVQFRLPGGTWSNLSGGPFTSTTVNVSGLSSNTTYEWRVATNCSNGLTSSWSGAVSFTTTGQVCATPGGAYTSNITQNTATLNWNAVPGALNYTVQFYTNGSWQNLGSGTFTGTSTGVYGLFANSTYQWRVMANCSSGQSAPSATITFYAGSAPNCSGGVQYPSTSLSPSTSWKYQTQMWGGEFCLVNVVSGQTYSFSYCSSDGAYLAFDGEISIKSTANQVIAYSDDYCGMAPKIVWRAGFTGQVRVLLTKYQCASQQTNSTMAYRIGASLTGDDPAARNAQEEIAFELFAPETAYAELSGSLASTAADWREPTSTENAAANGVSGLMVFPNPVSDRLTLRFDNQSGETAATLRVSDAMGRLLLTTDYSPVAGSNFWEIQTGHWPEGMYVIHLSTQNGLVYNERIRVLR